MKLNHTDVLKIIWGDGTKTARPANGWLTRLGEYCSRELEVIDNPEFLEVNNVKP